MTGEPRWMSKVKWPPCDSCSATGVAVEEKTGWPIECLRCKSGRVNAIKVAKADIRREDKGVGGP